MGAVRRGTAGSAVVGWFMVLGLTGIRLAPGDTPEWVAPLLTVSVAVAVTATLAAIIHTAMPSRVEAYRLGVEVGEHRVHPDTPRPHLRPVR